MYYLVDLQVDLKYLLGYLNSSLVGFWLRNKGKVKGEILEMYPEPLRSIPFKYSSLETKVSSLVNSVIDMKRKDENCDISDIQNEIDKLFYSIFELTADEIEHIEAKGVR